MAVVGTFEIPKLFLKPNWTILELKLARINAVPILSGSLRLQTSQESEVASLRKKILEQGCPTHRPRAAYGLRWL